MTTSYKTSGQRMRHAHTAAVESGEAIIVGTLLGIALGKYDADETGIYVVEGIHTLPKTNGARAIGSRVFWDVSTRKIGNGNAANGDLENCGTVAVAAVAGDGTVAVRLSPGVGVVKAKHDP